MDAESQNVFTACNVAIVAGQPRGIVVSVVDLARHRCAYMLKEPLEPHKCLFRRVGSPTLLASNRALVDFGFAAESDLR